MKLIPLFVLRLAAPFSGGSIVTRVLPVVLVLACAGVRSASARIFEPALPPAALKADAQTEALYEFTPDAVKTGQLPDAAGKSPAGTLSGKWAAVAPEELIPQYAGAGRIAMLGKKRTGTFAVFRGIKALQGGAFSVDVTLRWGRQGGIFLRIGNDGPQALSMGVLHRGPGLFELRVPVKSADGSVSLETFASSDIYIDAGPVRFGDFYTYSLTFDGRDTFQVWIDGRRVFEGKLKPGQVYAAQSELAVGDAGVWKSGFSGEIAAVRVSRGVRAYAAAVTETVFEKEARRGWVFDAGTASSPVEAGAIRVTAGDGYDARRGYGWMSKPVGDFDNWYVPGRFLHVAEAAYQKGEHKVLDALLRDGVILKSGSLFRADIPAGKYWVSVELGDNRQRASIAELTANGTVMGENLRMNGNLVNNQIIARGARALVTVEKGKGLVISARCGEEGGNVPVKSIEVLPYAPLPLVYDNGVFQWHGQGQAPAALEAVAREIKAGRPDAAMDEARKLSDAFVRACAMAVVLGQPQLPDEKTLSAANELRQVLLGVLRRQPDNVAARWLFDSTERFRHALVAYVDEGGDEVVFGSRFALWLATPNLGLQMRPEDPEYWQAQFLAGASIWQSATQASAFDTTPGALTDKYIFQDRVLAFDAPGWIFRKVIEKYPECRIARIMLGEQLPVNSAWKAPEGAPEWACLQYQLLQRLLETIHYWVNERMDEKGLLGGGMGDDVEALRWWGAAVLVADDKTTIDGMTRMAETVWASTRGTGYSLGMDDVEHSAEPTSDSLPMLALIHFDTPLMPQTQERLTKTFTVFRDLWSTVTPEGYRMFKGHHMNATKIEREGDVPYNLRAIRPFVWGVWAEDGKDPGRKALLVDYARSWRDATMAEFDGKPRGVVPMLVMLDRKRARLDGAKDWAAPGYSRYIYPRGYADRIYELFFAAYELTGDASFLEPIRYALGELRAVADGDTAPDKYPPASKDWALRAALPDLGAAGGIYRSLTGDHSLDDVLARFGPPHTRFEIGAAKARTPEAFRKEMEPVIQDLKACLREMNCNPELRTTMVQSTDRIYVKGSPSITAMATGIAAAAGSLRGMETIWPTYQVTWQGTGGQVAVLVEKASPSELDVLLYNFDPQPRRVQPRVWKLDAGSYRLTVSKTDESGKRVLEPVASRRVQISRNGQALELELPARIPLKWQLTKE